MTTGNILIAGDSFCGDQDYWPSFLLQNFYAVSDFPMYSLVISSPGSGWWPIRELILADRARNAQWYERLEWLIYIHPSSVRPPAADEIISQTIAQNLPSRFDNTMLDEAVICKSLYYKYIYHPHFHQWAMLQWSKELANIFSGVGIINLFADANDIPCDTGIMPGIVTSCGLSDLAVKQYPPEHTPELIAQDRQHGFYNHLTEANNRILAQQLFKIIRGQAQDLDPQQFNGNSL